MKKIEIIGKKVNKADQKKVLGGKFAPLCLAEWAPCGINTGLTVCCAGLYCAEYGAENFCRVSGQY